MKILFFAWVRENIGKSEETVTPPDAVETVQDLITWLKGRGQEYQRAFSDPEKIHVAIDQTFVNHDHSVKRAKEVAFFPPVTGG